MGIAWLNVSGEIDIATAPILREHLSRLVEKRLDIVVLLEEVQYFDMAGVHALEEFTRRCLERARRLVVASPAPIVRRVLDVVGVDDVPVLPSRAAALAYLKGGEAPPAHE